MIALQGLAKAFGATVVFDHLAFSVDKGEFVCIFGPSGCGKTTLLRMLAGLEPADRGSIHVDGMTPAADPEGYARKISVVWQDHRLLPWRTSLANVTLPLELRGDKLSRHELRRRAMDSLEFVGLADVADQLPRQLSGGMRQRVNLARALIMDSALVLMDEPLASLNEATDKQVLMEKFARLADHPDRTFIYVTHSISEAVFLADKIVVLSYKPTRILDTITVDLPRPRDLDSPAATAVSRRIRALLGSLVL